MHDSRTSQDSGSTAFDPHSASKSSSAFMLGDQKRSDKMSGFNWTPSELQEIVDGNELVIFMKGTLNSHNADSLVVVLRL